MTTVADIERILLNPEYTDDKIDSTLSEQGDILKVLIEHNRVDLVQKILEKSSDNRYKFHRVVFYGIQNALNIATRSGHTEIVKLLLAKDESGNYIHPGINVAADDNFALQVAAFHGHTEIVKLLLAKDESGNYIQTGVDVAVDNNCALRLAASKGYIEIVKLLLAKDESGNYIHTGVDVAADNNFALRRQLFMAIQK